jgi:SAM-dependent methyltransferase
LSPGKANFDNIYDRPDPRAYFRALRPLEYQIPAHAGRVFAALLGALRGGRPEEQPITVVDVCCGYGIIAALLKHRLRLEDLYRHYGSAELARVTPAELAAVDRAYFDAARVSEPVRVVGLDIARNAVNYAREVGLLDAGFVENLETSAPSPALRVALARASLVTIAGGVSYLTERTLQQIIDVVSGPVWVAAFVLRTVSYQRFAEALGPYGLVTERSSITFPQRKFSDAEERRFALQQLVHAGKEPIDGELKGYYHAELFLSRPARDAARLPLERLQQPSWEEPHD